MIGKLDTIDDEIARFSGIQGKFLLSSYPNEQLDLFTQKFNWNSQGIDMNLSASNSKKRKVEMLTKNY